MTEFEAKALVLEYLVAAHEFGEAVWNQTDIWIGVSSGLIVMAYFAPDRLTKGLTILILALYSAMTTFIFTSVLTDLQSAGAIYNEATILSESFGLKSDALVQRMSADVTNMIGFGAGLIFFVGLFLGTNGYLIYTCFAHTKKPSSGEGT